MFQEFEVPLSEYDSLHDSATLFLACPKTELSGPNPFRQLLTSFTPCPHLAVMTGPCRPLTGYNNANVNLSDIVVVTCKTPLSIEGVVQHTTELWRLKGDLNEMFSDPMVTVYCVSNV